MFRLNFDKFFLILFLGYTYELNENGFIVKGSLGNVRIRIATVISNYSKLDPSVHIPLRVLENHAAAIKHVYVTARRRNICVILSLL